MQQHGVYRNVRFAVLGAHLIAGTACFRHSADPDAVIENAESADSARSARTDRRRSSATQMVVFEESERTRFTRVELMIQARFSGVQVVQNGGAFTIKIRGTGSFASSNEPLIIIDGATRSTGDLGSVSPKDVLRIEIMKDAAASFYGLRGANGVIVITTRRGE
jgi:TonB-dependent SusC/RagA subfamily outer membrane receptor